MARKLTPEELERNKTDFDIPVGMKPLKPKKKTPQKKATEQPAQKKGKRAAVAANPEPDLISKSEPPKGRHPGGRPGAFREVQIVTLKLPPADVIKLKVKAAEQGKTMAQVIHDWLN